jgi:hypothetical protein
VRKALPAAQWRCRYIQYRNIMACAARNRSSRYGPTSYRRKILHCRLSTSRRAAYDLGLATEIHRDSLCLPNRH